MGIAQVLSRSMTVRESSSEHWDETEPVEFEVELQSEATYYPVESSLSAKLSLIADVDISLHCNQLEGWFCQIRLIYRCQKIS